jgi:hypothetical protein
MVDYYQRQANAKRLLNDILTKLKEPIHKDILILQITTTPGCETSDKIINRTINTYIEMDAIIIKNNYIIPIKTGENNEHTKNNNNS